jgi:Family of unknown function (DUF6134)
MGRAIPMVWRRWRRALAIALIVVGLPAGAPPAVATVERPADLSFDIVRDGSVIGRHTTRFSTEGDHLIATVTIRILVKIIGIPVFRYEQDSREEWAAGRLIALDSHTNDDGDKASVTARAEGDRLRVDGQAGRVLLAGDTIPTSYWNHALVAATSKLDTERGIAIDLQVGPPTPDTVEVDGKPAATQRYAVTGKFDMTWWYLPDGAWAKLEFRGKDGTPINYVRRAPDTTDAAPAGR